jgi:hypothetical protein
MIRPVVQAVKQQGLITARRVVRAQVGGSLTTLS